MDDEKDRIADDNFPMHSQGARGMAAASEERMMMFATVGSHFEDRGKEIRHLWSYL